MLGIIQTLKEKAGLAFYSHPQKYDVSMDIILQNTSSSSKDFALVLPLPRSDFSQQVIEGPVIFPAAEIKTDSLYGNRYVVFSGNAGSVENFLYKVSFKVAVSPRQIEPTQTFALHEYGALDRDLVAKWTASSPHIDVRDPRILNLANEAKKRAGDVWSIVKNLNEYVIDRLHYGNPITGLYTTSDALEKDVVDCGGFDVLFIALCRSLGIPARLVSGFWAGYKNNDMHAWAEVLLPDGQWMPVDPSVEQLARRGRTMKGGKLGFAGSNRVVFSYGADVPIEVGDKKVSADILQNPFLAFSEMNTQFQINLNIKTKWA